MTKCPQCSKEFEDGMKFCDECGVQLVEVAPAPAVETAQSSDASVIQPQAHPAEAMPVNQAPVAVAPVPVSAPVPAPVGAMPAPAAAKPFPKKALLFGAIGLVAIIAIVLLVLKLTGNKKTDYSLYLKNGQLVYSDYSEKGTKEITTRLLSSDSTSGSRLARAASTVESFVCMNENGSRIFYPDRIYDSSEGVTLYCRNINKPDEEPIKIDSDVLMYAINDAGSEVIYVKNSNRALYRHDLTEKEKIASGVLSFKVADDCGKIGYLTDEDNYYIWNGGDESLKLASNISRLEYVADDLSVIYYTKDGSLYKQVNGSDDKQKLASDISRVLEIYDSGEVYYTKTATDKKNLMDYVDDDFASADASVTEPKAPEYPEYPDYPYYWDFETTEEYDAAMIQYKADYETCEETRDKLRTEYNNARTAYREKSNRDALRETLKSQTLEQTVYALYYFNGTEETLINDAMAGDADSYADEKPVMIFEAYNQSDVKKVKLSEITNAFTVKKKVNEALYSSTERYIVLGATATALTQTDATNFTIASDGSAVYFLDDTTSNSAELVGDLYKMVITDGQLGNAEIFDSNVSAAAIFFYNDSNELAYYKNVDDAQRKGDLYINGKEIDYDVKLWSLYDMDDTIVYFTDWDNEKNFGTLKTFCDETKTKVADDVHDLAIIDGDLLYLYDYSSKYYTGTLYKYNNGSPKKLDDDVVSLITPYESGVRGNTYYSDYNDTDY